MACEQALYRLHLKSGFAPEAKWRDVTSEAESAACRKIYMIEVEVDCNRIREPEFWLGINALDGKAIHHSFS